MSQLKKAWIIPFATCDRLFSLTVESAQTQPEYERISSHSAYFQARDSHVTVVGLFDDSDLRKIRDVIDAHLAKSSLVSYRDSR